MRIFREPNPNLRRPAALQSNTKQNLVLNVVLFVIWLVSAKSIDRYLDNKLEKQFEAMNFGETDN